MWLSRLSSLLSVKGSLAIIYIIYSGRRRKLVKPKNRFMLMMSIFDVVHSTAILVSTAAMPRHLNIYGARGNDASCTAQSIFMVIGLAVPLYNSSLNLFYLLTIKYNMDSTRFSSKIEPFLHASSILVPILFASIFTALGYANPIGISTCLFEGKVPCFGFGVTSLFCFLFCAFSMGSIFWSMRSQANMVRKHRFASTNHPTILNEKEMAKQALLYFLAFFLSFSFPTVQVLVNILYPDLTISALQTLTSIFYPLQGFFNFVFYIRPGVIHVRKNDTSKSYIAAVCKVIFDSEAVSNGFRTRGSADCMVCPISRHQTNVPSIADCAEINLSNVPPSTVGVPTGDGEVIEVISKDMKDAGHQHATPSNKTFGKDVDTALLENINVSKHMNEKGILPKPDEETPISLPIFSEVNNVISFDNIAICDSISLDSSNLGMCEDNGTMCKVSFSPTIINKRASINFASIL